MPICGRTQPTNSLTRLFGGILILVAPLCLAAGTEVTATQVVSAIEGVYGVTPGERRNHTKGTCAVGEFVGEIEQRI